MPGIPDVNGAEHNVPTLFKETMGLAQRFDWPLPRMTWRDEVQQSYEAYKVDISASVAREVDLSMIMRYFDLQELIARVFDELMQLDAFMSVTDNGSQQTHPHLAMFARLITTSVRLANEIGTTPMSRVKLGLYATEGAAAQAALERAVNADPGIQAATQGRGVKVSVEPGDDDTVDAEIVMEW